MTVRPRPSAPQGHHCEMSHFLAMWVPATFVKVDILVYISIVVNWQMLQRVSADQHCMTVSRVQLMEVTFFISNNNTNNEKIYNSQISV